jgi:hypothetical protein
MRELERAIVDAVMVGAFNVARVLADQLADRQRTRTPGVVDDDSKAAGDGEGPPQSSGPRQA